MMPDKLRTFLRRWLVGRIEFRCPKCSEWHFCEPFERSMPSVCSWHTSISRRCDACGVRFVIRVNVEMHEACCHPERGTE